MVTMGKISSLISFFMENMKKKFRTWLTVCLLLCLLLIRTIRGKLQSLISGNYVSQQIK